MEKTVHRRCPEYKRVYDVLREKIAGGEYAMGTLLPTEPELEKMFGVSRTTVRKAVELLTGQGMVLVKQGFGTQVINRKTVQNLNRLTSISQTLIDRGYEIGNKSIYVERLQARGQIAEELEVEPGTPLYCIHRILTADGQPVTLSENYILASLVPELQNTKEKILSWYAYLQEHYGVVMTRAKDLISACNAGFEESELLQVDPGSALITIRRICYSGDRPVEVDWTKTVASKYELEIFMQGAST